MKKLLLGLGIVSLGCLPLVAVASCGSSNGLNTHLTAKSFQAKQTRAEESVVDPSLNIDAQKILNGLFENLTVQQLQLDFNRILVDFYDIYEFQSANTEIELIDGGIKVLSIETDKNTNVKTAKLEVSYEVEVEKSKNDSKNDGTIKTEKIDWIIRPKIIAQTEINAIKRIILESTTTNSNIDIKDLKEYFLGEKDADEADDIGVFDRINAINKSKDLKNSGGLVGYEINLNDIFGKLPTPPKQQVTLDTTFFAPSLALNNVFLYPSQQPKLDYTLDLTVLQTIDLATIKTYTTVAQLESFLVNKTQATATLVKSIVVEEVGPLIKVTVNFVDPATLPEAFSINPNLLKKQPVTPPTPPIR